MHIEIGCKVLLNAFPSAKPYLDPICSFGDSHPTITFGLLIGLALVRRMSKPLDRLVDNWWRYE